MVALIPRIAPLEGKLISPVILVSRLLSFGRTDSRLMDRCPPFKLLYVFWNCANYSVQYLDVQGRKRKHG
jgi:hypothetical protein